MASDGKSLGERLRARVGRDVDPRISLREREAKRPASSGEILKRLGARTGESARYRMRGEIARGGMGAILEVWDEDLRRRLAMKVVLGSDGQASAPPAEEVDSIRLGRFLEEAQITGQLDHPGIVPVHELGLDPEGRVYFTMRLVRGKDLAEVFELASLDQDGWSVTRVLGAILRACEAMAFAHDRGVIHRDLKPANVMVGRFGEVYVMDWGLARVLDRGENAPESEADESDTESWVVSEQRQHALRVRSGSTDSNFVTCDGDVFGTPAFMSPEQARGDMASLDARSDVYSMGAMLYELLTGVVPYTLPGEDASALRVLQRVLQGPPPALTKLAPDAPAELVAITERAMARHPAARYANMNELAEDLRSFLEGRVVRAHRTGAVAELSKWIARNRATATAAAAALLAALAGLGGVAWIQARSNDELAERNALLEVARDEAHDAAELARAESERAESAATTSDEVVDFLVGMFELQDPDRARGRTITVKEVLDVAARDIRDGLGDQPEARARLLGTMGDVYRSLGLFDEAQPLLEDAVAVHAASTEPGGMDAIEARLALARLEFEHGDYAAAEHDAAKALDAIEDRDDGPDTAGVRGAALTTLALVERDTARPADALAHLEAARDAYRDVGEALTPRAFEVERLLVELGGAGEEFDELERAHVGLLRRAERALGADHQTTLELRLAVARLCRRFGALDRAETALLEVLERRRELLGSEHPRALAAATELAFLYANLGRFDDSVALFEQTLTDAREALGREHHDVLVIQNQLGTFLKDVGRLDESRTLLEQTIDTWRRRFGEIHGGTAAALNNLGLVEMLARQVEAAEKAFARSLDVRRVLYGPNAYETLQSESNLALAYRGQGRHEEALVICERVLSGYEGIFGPDHPETMTVLDNLAVTFYYLGRLDEARERFAEIARRGSAVFGDAHPVVARARNNLGAVLIKLDRWREALAPLELAVSGSEESYGAEHPETLKAVTFLGRVQLHEQDWWAAEASFERASIGFAAAYGEDHPLALGALFSRGRALEERGESTEALAIYRDVADRAPEEFSERAELDAALERLD